MRHRERGTRTRPPGQDLSGPDLSGPDELLEALLAGRPLPEEEQAALQPVADMLTALRAPATVDELIGQASAMAAFRAAPHRTPRTARPHRPLLRPRPVTALAASAVVVAGLAAFGYEGDLPTPVQQWAHHMFGLTAARTTPSPTPGHAAQHGQHSLTPTPGPRRHQHAAAHHESPGHGRPHEGSHRPPDGDRHRHHGSPGGPGPSSGPGSAPSPSARGSSTPGPSARGSSTPGTPGPGNTPAAQPSAQPSTGSGQRGPHQASSGPPSSPP